MANTIDRRQWLKSSAFAAAALMARSPFEAFREVRPVPRNFSGNEGMIALDSNESPYGISESARQAIIGAMDMSNRYPHNSYSLLKELIAERENITPNHILLGAGSTEVMVTLIHFMKANGEIVLGDPSYFDFIYYAERSDRALNGVRLNGKFEHDLEAMSKRITPRTVLVYICNPNNPTGSITPKDKLQPFCEHISKDTLVVVDEAYHEYVEDKAYTSMIDLVKKGRNVVITRTFSKIFGLAGLRIGYGIAHPDLIEKLNRLSRNFAPVAWLSLKAAIASYRDQPFIQQVREKNQKAKAFVTAELNKMGLSCIPSHTNFVLFPIDRNASELAERLEARKVLVRPFAFHGKQWIRVSCGTQEEMQGFLSNLSALL